METITITLPSKLAAHARSLAEFRRQGLTDFIQTELQRLLAPKNGRRIKHWVDQLKAREDLQTLSDQEVMEMANLRMEKWQALQMHRLNHLADIHRLSSNEEKILETLLEIHNEVGIKKARGIAEAVRRGLLPSTSDAYWSAPPRRKLLPRKRTRK